MFLQRPAHSLTVVGMERDRNGRRRLLVFDPAYQPIPLLKPLLCFGKPQLIDRLILHHYRRDERYLKRYPRFEILFLTDAT